MAARRTGGRIRECHGDLHCRNIVRLAGRLVAFDCLEYEPAFRWIDVADEVAFLASDLGARGHPLHAHAFVAAYLEEGGDYQACRVLRVYEAHRALVRAKVAALSAAGTDGAQQEALRDEHARLVIHAATSLGRQAPVIILMHGLSGSGKTYLAQQLAASLRAIHIRSDVERKRHGGLAVRSRSGSSPGAGLYTRDISTTVYALLADAALDALAGGYPVIVDASFLRHEQRALFGEVARRSSVPAHLVSCTAPEAVLKARIAVRNATGSDPSEADEAVLGWQQSQVEPLEPGEPFNLIRIDTTDPQAAGAVLAALRP
jgi:predicted kinase